MPWTRSLRAILIPLGKARQGRASLKIQQAAPRTRHLLDLVGQIEDHPDLIRAVNLEASGKEREERQALDRIDQSRSRKIERDDGPRLRPPRSRRRRSFDP
jgi:hypothetical protein